MNWDKIILETYRDMFAISEPKADFDKLMETSPKNERGQIDIPFLNYEIKQEDYDRIISEKIKKYKIKGDHIRRFKTTIALGCSPKTYAPDQRT